MHYVTFGLPQLHEYGPAFFDYLKLRKQFFVDQLNWPIVHNRNVEMDEYDNPETQYSLVLKEGKVIGGARCIATNTKWGNQTYMVADAFQGQMSDIPCQNMPGAKVSPHVWECSRLVISDDLTDRAERMECLHEIIEGCINITNRNGAGELMALSSVAMLRALRQLGYGVQRLADPYRDRDDGRLYCVMSMPAVSTQQLIAAE
ncbi:Autoinducer synthesis protein [Candidatus Rhodobacter oscarellae]|uniref:Acyl-homoserine-lactone synthase n=1 Tax=Candidatus Rhodobacter oscarellae TaxID=1675527 RepID=A0A0J9EDP9_9RHOB|nr:acyl-homoserine-lactone synthase [Candidatus Rhodobacter lobularis]KMW60741.1 Autoinducer synthesis protein [Candidatus Rhodobacter lobularis]